MLSSTSAYYLWPTCWVEAAPRSANAQIDLSQLADEVFRTSLTGGIEIKVLREGLFVFDFKKWEQPSKEASDSFNFDDSAQIVLRRTNVMNVHLMCLYSCIAKELQFSTDKMILSPSDLIAMKSIDEEGASFGDTRVAELALSRYASTYRSQLPNQFDWRLSRRSFVISLETLKNSFSLLEVVLCHANSRDLLAMIEILAKSCRAFEDHNYALGLITAWAVSERLVQTIWERYLQENTTRELGGVKSEFIDGRRKKRLLDGRSFTAAVVIESLSFAGKLPFELFKKLSESRKARNDWAHSLSPVSRNGASSAIEAAQELLELVEGIKFSVPLISRLHG